MQFTDVEKQITIHALLQLKMEINRYLKGQIETGVELEKNLAETVNTIDNTIKKIEGNE